MLRRLLVAAGVLAALLVLFSGPARADRLGGAYRGPFEDNTTLKENVNPEVSTEAKGSEKPTQSGGGSSGSDGESAGGGTGGDDGGGDDGGATPPPGDGGSAAPPPTEGGSSGGSAKAPDVGGATGGLSGSGETTGRGKKAQEDVLAYWPFWFEHNKEWLLGQIFEARSAGLQISRQNSAFTYMTFGNRARSPVTDEQREKTILPLLVKYTTHESSFVRDAAVMALGKLGLPQAIPTIIQRLGDPDPDVVEDTLLALGYTRDKAALDPLISSLARPERRAFAALGLGLLGRPEALQPLLKAYKEALSRADPYNSAACIAAAIGALGDESIVDEFAAPLVRNQTSQEVKAFICQGLARIGGEKALNWLRRALSSESDEGVQAGIVMALASFPDKNVANLLLGKEGIKAGKTMPKVFAAVSLGRIGATLDPADGLWKRMATELKDAAEAVRTNKYLAMYGALGLAMLGSDAANAFFRESLGEEGRTQFSEENHTAMAIAAGVLEMREVIPDLRQILTRTGSPDYRGYAAFALGLLGDQGAREILREELKDSRGKEQVLRSCCWALGLLGDRKDLDVLLEALRIEQPTHRTVRGAAAIAIGMIGDRAAVNPLVKMIENDPKNEDKAFAIAALGCLVDREPMPRLPRLLSHFNYRVRPLVIRDALLNL